MTSKFHLMRVSAAAAAAAAVPLPRLLSSSRVPHSLSLSLLPAASLSYPTASLSYPTAAFSAAPPPLFSLIRVSAMSTSSTDHRDDHRAVFALSPTSSLKIQKGDITRWSVDRTSDAIVNAANERMLGGGGVDGAIHRAAGPELREACYKVPQIYPGVRCPTGEARITSGFRLPASHVIHTVGPVYDEDEDPEALLESAYINTLTVAKENNIQYVAFPAISCGVYGYPYDEAASVAISTIKKFADDFKEVHFVLFLDDIYDAWLEKARELVGEDRYEKIDEEVDSEMQVEEHLEKIAGEEGTERIAGEGSVKIAGEEGSEKTAEEGGTEIIAREGGSEMIADEEGSEKIAGEGESEKIVKEQGS